MTATQHRAKGTRPAAAKRAKAASVEGADDGAGVGQREAAGREMSAAAADSRKAVTMLGEVRSRGARLSERLEGLLQRLA